MSEEAAMSTKKDFAICNEQAEKAVLGSCLIDWTRPLIFTSCNWLSGGRTMVC